VRWICSVAVCLAALPGCGGGERERPAGHVLPAGFTTRVVETPAFSIALPRRWPSYDAVTRPAASLRATPRLRAELTTLTRPDSPIKLVAIDPAEGREFLTSMNVLQTRVPRSLSFEQLAWNEARQIKLALHVKDVHQEETELTAGRALRLSYRARSKAVVYQYFVRHGDFLYVLTYTTSPAKASRYAKIFDVSAHTFRLR
jgi:hypothetical protein